MHHPILNFLPGMLLDSSHGSGQSSCRDQGDMRRLFENTYGERQGNYQEDDRNQSYSQADFFSFLFHLSCPKIKTKNFTRTYGKKQTDLFFVSSSFLLNLLLQQKKMLSYFSKNYI